MPRTILIPTDFSPCSVYSLQWAAKNLFQNKDNLILLHIVSDEPVIIDSEIGCIAEDDNEVNKNVALVCPKIDILFSVCDLKQKHI